jgi:hypothetical protein
VLCITCSTRQEVCTPIRSQRKAQMSALKGGPYSIVELCVWVSWCCRICWHVVVCWHVVELDSSATLSACCVHSSFVCCVSFL